MRLLFGKRQLSDLIRVIQFMDKEGIEYEAVGDIGVNIGAPGEEAEERGPAAQKILNEAIPDMRRSVVDSDPEWVPSFHDGARCTDKEGCKVVQHYGGEPL
jgi:hypothetical protein